MRPHDDDTICSSEASQGRDPLNVPEKEDLSREQTLSFPRDALWEAFDTDDAKTMDQLGDPPSVLSEPDAPVSDNGHRAPDGPEEPTRAHVETPDLLTVWNATALPQIQANPGLLVDADIIALATAIYRTDNLGWYELARGLEGIKGYKAREWKKIIATEAKRQAEAETRAAQQAQRIAASSPSGPLAPVTLPRVEDIWPDAPVRVREWPVPADRRFDAGPQGVARKVGEDPLTGERVMTPITYVPLMIIGGAEPMDTDGEGWLELLWRAGAEWKAVWLPRKQVMSLKNAPDTLNTLNIRIAHDEIKAVLKWLELTEQVGLQAGVWGDQHLTNTLGWKRVQNAWGFMLPEQWIGPALPGGNDHVVFWPKGRGSAGADLFKAHGDIAEESRLLADILAEIPQFAWLMGHGAAAPLHRRLSRLHVTGNLNGYVVELASAQSSTGKTSLTALALSPWRSPYIPIAQYSSAFALEQQLLETNDLPTAIQELQADQKSKVDWSSVVHMIAEKGGRVRGQKTGGYAVAETLHTTLFVANNQSILSMVGDQAGAAARILSLNHIIPQRRLDDPRQSAQLKTLIEGWMARVSQHHGHGGRAMVAVLTTMTDADLLSQYQAAEAVVDQMRAAWPAASGEVAKVLGRQAHAWAMGLLGLRLLLQHGYGWTPQAVAQAEAGYLEAIQQGILPASAFDQQSEAERWWETACSLLNEHAMEFAGLELTDRDGNVIAPRAYRGRYFADEDLIGVLPEWFQGELKRNGRKDFKSIYTEWCRKGWMIRGEEKFTIVKSMKKVGQVAVATRLLCFRASAVGFGVVLPEPNEMHDQAPQAPAPEPPAVIPSVQEEPPTPHELQEPLSPAALVRRLYAKQQRGGAP